MKVHFLQDQLTHKAQRPAFNYGRTRWATNNYQPFSSPLGKGSKKYGRNYSKCIGNPSLRRAGAGIIWTTV